MNLFSLLLIGFMLTVYVCFMARLLFKYVLWCPYRLHISCVYFCTGFCYMFEDYICFMTC